MCILIPLAPLQPHLKFETYYEMSKLIFHPPLPPRTCATCVLNQYPLRRFSMKIFFAFKWMHKAQAGALPKCMKRRVPLTISKRKIVDAPSYMLDLLCWMDIFTVQQISSSAQKVKVLHFLLFYQILWQRLFDVHFLSFRSFWKSFWSIEA